jgi:type I restriction enzyme, R subunit
LTIFGFLAEFPECNESAEQAAKYALGDPRTSCFHARRSLELMVGWAFKHDQALRMPYDDNLSALVNSSAFKQVAGDNVFKLARDIIQYGNSAVHRNAPVRQIDAVQAVSKLFHVSFWFARTYAKVKPDPDLKFDPNVLPRTTVPQQTIEQLRTLETSLADRDRVLAEAQASNADLNAQLEMVRAEIVAAKRALVAVPDTHDYSEAESRDFFIDLLLREAGWSLTDKRDREFPVTGMPNSKGGGFVDYVLWGADGLPLGLVEAKRTKRDPAVGLHQAKLYADCLEAQFGQRPVIFTSNGYEHWIWDDTRYPRREVQGFYARDELALLIQRRSMQRPLSEVDINNGIVERFYQARAIRAIGEAFGNDHERKALIVMATGAGKTRTVIALSDLLVRANWAKRVLFLADRTALVKQAVNAFKTHLPDSSPVNLVSDRHDDGRVYVSTYQTMLNLINDVQNGRRRFGVGFFDLVVIDEAHRSVFQKYKAIFEYFDCLLVGLTATPREEIERNTYGLFDLETGVPTDAYPLAEAVNGGFLVPATPVSVPLKFQREGIKYDDLPEEEKDQWDDLDWSDDPLDDSPDEVGAEAINKWLFNKDTVDKVLAHVMANGIKVAGGDRLGKTIVFAKNQAHADFIRERFDANYPHYRGHFAQVITHKVEYGQDLIDKFSLKESEPHIAISVDMLDTGIDVPEVVNLVFFKLLRSKTKFWQMLGRGTRLCKDLFGPGQDKTTFKVFDFCQNLEYFNQATGLEIGSNTPSLSTRLFRNRVELIGELDKTHENPEIRTEVSEVLRTEVAAMNVDNFLVRPHRRAVEQFREPAGWNTIGTAQATVLSAELAGLPTELPSEREEPKRFDLLLLNLELALLKSDPSFMRLQEQVQTIAGLLEERSSIPLVHQQIELIADVQTDEWWQDVNLTMLEHVRRRLRDLVGLIEKGKRRIIYTDFTDTIGDGDEIALSGFSVDGFERFKLKARAYVREHRGELAIKRIHMNWPITPDDTGELKRVLREIGTDADIERAEQEAGSFGLFVRGLVGLDREAAQGALATFLDRKRFNSRQIDYIGLVIQELTVNGTIEARRFYEAPYTDLAPSGPDTLFTETEVDELITVLNNVRNTAA